MGSSEAGAEGRAPGEAAAFAPHNSRLQQQAICSCTGAGAPRVWGPMWHPWSHWLKDGSVCNCLKSQANTSSQHQNHIHPAQETVRTRHCFCPDTELGTFAPFSSASTNTRHHLPPRPNRHIFSKRRKETDSSEETAGKWERPIWDILFIWV